MYLNVFMEKISKIPTHFWLQKKKKKCIAVSKKTIQINILLFLHKKLYSASNENPQCVFMEK